MPGKAQDHRELQACNYSYQKLQTQTTTYKYIPTQNLQIIIYLRRNTRTTKPRPITIVVRNRAKTNRNTPF